MEEKSGFHLRFKPGSMIFSALAALGYLVLMQQGGSVTVTPMNIGIALLLGLIAGVLIPTLATLIPRKKKASPDAAEPAAASPPSGGAQ